MTGVLLFTLLVSGGCGFGSSSDAPVADASGVYAPLREALAKWDQPSGTSGEYRVETNPAMFLGQPDAGDVKQVTTGGFAYAPPDRFRVAGTQRMIGGDVPAGLPSQAEIELIYDRRTVTMVRKMALDGPTPRVVRIGPRVYDQESPFVPKTALQGTPFGNGDIVTVVRRMGELATFERTESVTEHGETLTAHVGQLDLERQIERMVAERTPTLGALLLVQESPKASADLVERRFEGIARSLKGGRHVRLLVDGDGWIRGWDVGPAPGRYAMQIRLSNLRGQVEDGAFVVDPELEASANDMTEGLVAQAEQLREAWSDAEAVEQTKQRLLEAVAAK